MNATDKQLKNNIDEFKGDEAKLDPLALKSFANSNTPSNPPTINRFKYNSFAMRKYNGISNVL